MEGLSLREGKKDRQIKREREGDSKDQLNQRDVDGDDADRKRLAFRLLY